MVASPVAPNPSAPGAPRFRGWLRSWFRFEPRFGFWPAGLLNAIAALLTWFARARWIAVSRCSLGAMDDRMLADIGVSHAQAKEEASRRFWDTG
jgi:uncharacterized protein YjiS (DUF1127 family)